MDYGGAIVQAGVGWWVLGGGGFVGGSDVVLLGVDFDRVHGAQGLEIEAVDVVLLEDEGEAEHYLVVVDFDRSKAARGQAADAAA